ncbi:hypothetical protein [Sinomicrobium soli]|uniref:hypothetical protein n=1 Tax=Sinomicrobium sp. N-1-3-6 TaxID=2219864 RepID=UPI000DCD0814|nr:hypothetical protein [Sinomicrobium sp. N-1-3-6]RAV30917.1 hypothetical protein DN748_01285 [Sinomicrobium sp. N-1-3-6]
MRTSGNCFFLIFRYAYQGKKVCRVFLGVLCLSGTVACRDGEKKRAPADDLVRDEIKNIDWNDVDRYPLFEECDENSSKAEQKSCFESHFVNYLYTGMNEHHIVVHGTVEDTIYVRFLIARTGEISVAEIESPGLWRRKVPHLDSIVCSGLEKVPKPYPALKRNIPVATKYRLPLVLKGDMEKPRRGRTSPF